jgi:hypothetical protein
VPLEALTMSALIDAIKGTVGIAKDLTLTGFMLWTLMMMITGKIVRKGELDTAINNITKADQNADWYRNKLFDDETKTKDLVVAQGAAITAQSAAIASLQRTVDKLSARLEEHNRA